MASRRTIVSVVDLAVVRLPNTAYQDGAHINAWYDSPDKKTKGMLVVGTLGSGDGNGSS
jgi:hypothetical protein